jgi:hypothetical protein
MESDMTVIRVDPASVRAYGTQAQGIFETMHGELVALVNDVVAVRFFGPNAVAFKTDSGKVAADFANKLNTDMGAMADAVRTSTSNIAASLGGTAITIQIDSKAITPPTPETVDYVDVDTSALESLIPVVNRHFTALRTGLKDNLSRLQATDWEGNAKTAAVESVAGFTTSAQAKVDSAEQSITNYITKQIEAVTSADK